MAAGPFDDAGGDRPAGGECLRVFQVVLLGEEVVGAAVGVAPVAGIETEAGGFAPDRGGDRCGLPVQDGEGFVVDPGLGGGVSFGEND